MGQLLLQTESSDIVLDNVERYNNYVFCVAEESHLYLLYRVLSDEEMLDRAPDAVLVCSDEPERLVLVSDGFLDSDAAFACMKCNENRVKQMLSELSLEGFVDGNESESVSSEPKVIGYDFLFNYFGGGYFQDKLIVGAGVTIAFRPYKNGELVKFTEEPKCVVDGVSRISDKPVKMTFWLSDMIDVSFDMNDLIRVNVDVRVYDLVRTHFGWDRIDFEIAEYALDYAESRYISAPLSVSKEDWYAFLGENKQYFNISDNHHAQCPSFSWLDT